MIVKGKYNQAKVFTDKLEEDAKRQIEELLSQDFIGDSKVRIMPDVHKGMGCVIGFTADMGDKVIPNIVGVDIGCGVLVVKLGRLNIDFKKIDKVISKEIPAGHKVHKKKQVDFKSLKELNIYSELQNITRIERSLGSLGGGNHFIELSIDSNKNRYLLIHSGSRNLGKQVADFYQNLAIDLLNSSKAEVLKKYQSTDLKEDISKGFDELDLSKKSYPKELSYLTGSLRERYLEDMKISQNYASLNRKIIADIILEKYLNKNLEDFSYFETIHNYIDFRDNVVRKGAISANKNEKIIIPINMRDGSILAKGKGNEDWNNSAPHGAGRLLSRTQARKRHSLNRFKEDMRGVYSTSISKKTLDENPRAYKPMDDILKNLDETAEVIDILKPIYNFKAD